MQKRTGPLAGMRVIDLTLALAGPLCTQRLGDMGAEIIKIEGPNRGDFTRKAAMRDVWLGGETTSFLSLNRNKHSIAVDLKSSEGQLLFLDLVAKADVVVQNFRPGVAERLGITFERLKAVNPRIVYVSISGYGDEGPMVERPGQDLLVQSFSGTTMTAGTKDGPPHPSPIYVVDVAASHNACEAVLAGIIQRDREGVGVEAKVSLLAAVLEIQMQEITTYMTTGRAALRGSAPYASAWMEPPYGLYKMRDGYMAMAQSSLQSIAEVLGSVELAELAATRPNPEDEPALLEWRDAIYPLLASSLAGRAVEETVQALHEAGVWCGPVLDYEALLAHPQSRGLFIEIDHPRAGVIRTLAPAIRFSTQEDLPMRPAPALGQDTEAVLSRMGITEERLTALKQKGIIA